MSELDYESIRLFRYLAAVRHDKKPNRIYVPANVLMALVHFSNYYDVPMTAPGALLFTGAFYPVTAEHAMALMWLHDNMDTYELGLERGMAAYEPN